MKIDLTKNDGDIIYKAAYDAEKRCIKSITLANENSISISASDSKLFAWNGKTLKPYCLPLALE